MIVDPSAGSRGNRLNSISIGDRPRFSSLDSSDTTHGVMQCAIVPGAGSSLQFARRPFAPSSSTFGFRSKSDSSRTPPTTAAVRPRTAVSSVCPIVGGSGVGWLESFADGAVASILPTQSHGHAFSCAAIISRRPPAARLLVILVRAERNITSLWYARSHRLTNAPDNAMADYPRTRCPTRYLGPLRKIVPPRLPRYDELRERRIVNR